jgi:hypothetical protein
VSQASRFERSSPRCSWAESCEVVAIASRKLAKARAAAEQFGISNAHGFYEELLADPNVEAVFNPLPNHLHVPWSIQAARAGKHVLCEKPIGLGALLGTKARIDVEVPVNAPLDSATRISINDCVEEIAACNQYTIQGELFSRAILESTNVYRLLKRLKLIWPRLSQAFGRSRP